MDPEREYKDIIEAIYRITAAVEKRFDALREADREMFKNSLSNINRRLEGFPEQYATKVDMSEASRALQRLERDYVSRESYDQQHGILEDAVSTKLSAAIFQAFVENYRTEQERFKEERADYLSQGYYDERHSTLTKQVRSIESWQYKLVGGLVFATFIAPLVTGILVYLFTSGTI